MSVDVGGGVITIIEFFAGDTEELEGLVEVGFGELGWEKLGEVEGWDVALP